MCVATAHWEFLGVGLDDIPGGRLSGRTAQVGRAVRSNRLFGNGIDVFGQTGNAAGGGAFVDNASFGGLVDYGFGLIKFGRGIIAGSPNGLYHRFHSGFNGFITQPAVFILPGTF